MTKEKTAKRGSTQRKNEKLNAKIENNEMPTIYKNNSRFSSKPTCRYYKDFPTLLLTN